VRPLLAAALLVAALPARAVDGLQVIVHPDVPVATLTRAELSDLFLKKTTRWPDGRAAVPVEPADKALRSRFAEAVHRRSAMAVRTYWNQLIFSGRELPPAEKRGDAAVAAFVRDTPGSVGYVSAAADVAGVKVVTVTAERAP
jgi:ABC-type phosphate transport system substrate-binding protein